jgi:hypothetical protein
MTPPHTHTHTHARTLHCVVSLLTYRRTVWQRAIHNEFYIIPLSGWGIKKHKILPILTSFFSNFPHLIFISWFMSNTRHKVKLQYLLSQEQYLYNMINKINKERRRSMNTTPIRPSHKNQRQGVQADPKQKQDRARINPQ